MGFIDAELINSTAKLTLIFDFNSVTREQSQSRAIGATFHPRHRSAPRSVRLRPSGNLRIAASENGRKRKRGKREREREGEIFLSPV